MMNAEHTPQDDSANASEIACLEGELRAVFGNSELGGPVLAKLGDALRRAGRLDAAIGRYEAAEVHLSRTNQENECSDVLRKIDEVRELLRQQQLAAAQTPKES